MTDIAFLSFFFSLRMMHNSSCVQCSIFNIRHPQCIIHKPTSLFDLSRCDGWVHNLSPFQGCPPHSRISKDILH
ncbi:hypothetical protein F5050DRAFT_1436566 [Lentinula boryana]|uniref:Secreted protein n=1 Tax=Lentinula boryana TaxID=40481 RepID=A0ABQ8QFR0_9AGAR|nr:hypothetical protein F5050DRAFT_1436566 [Lentinula boryana]